MHSGPVHATAFQARLDDQLVGAFDAPAADRKALRLKSGVLDLVQPFGQIVQRGVARLVCSSPVSGLVDRQMGQRLQQRGGAMLVVFEAVGLLFDPRIGLGRIHTPGGLGRFGQLTGALMIIVYLARLTLYSPTNPLVLIGAGLTGLIVSPIFFIWLGRSLLRSN